MKTFPSQYERDGDSCPICGRQDQKEAMFVPIAGTEDATGKMNALTVHVDCLLESVVYVPMNIEKKGIDGIFLFITG